MLLFPRTLLLLLFVSFTYAQDKLTYRVEYAALRKDHLHVIIQPSRPKKAPTTLVIPRAIPSGYGQQFYDHYVSEITAQSSDGEPLKLVHEDGPRWRVDSTKDIASVAYDVNLQRQESEILSASDSSKVRSKYVGLLGYSVLGFLEGTENLPIRLEVVAPDNWPIFTTLAPKAIPERTNVSAEAKDFFSLADSQIAMGEISVLRLTAPVPLFVVFYTEAESNEEKRAEVFADAFRKVLAYFGEPPFESYTAYIEILKPVSDRHEYGFSMEHLNSSTYFLGTDRSFTTSTTTVQIERDRFNFAHHVAHSWIPKQVYGTGYLPFSWELAPQIDTIWFNEGFARYAATEALADAKPEAEGKAYRQRQIELLKQIISSMPPFIQAMPLTELSRIGSLMYSGDFRVGRTLFSKGALMAAEMDQRVRELTRGKKRLRDSLRSMVRWGRASRRPFRLAELPGLIARPVGVDEREIREIMLRWSK